MIATHDDIRDAVRGLRRSPAFTIALVCAVMVGVGASVTFYSAADALLFRTPSGVQSGQDLVELYTSRFTGSLYGPSSYPDFSDLSATSRSFATLAAYRDGPATSVRVNGVLREYEYAEVSEDFFETLVVKPQAGSLAFIGWKGAPPAAIISSELASAGHGLTVGAVVTLNAVDHSVVGIAPAGFSGLHVGSSPQLWIALSPEMDDGARGHRTLRLIGRLQAGVSLKEAQAELNGLPDAVANRVSSAHRGSEDGEAHRFTVTRYSRLEGEARSQAALIGTTLIAAAAVVLLSGCVNAGALLLARWLGRRKSLAVRVAVGASRGRLARMLLCESLLLATIGAAGGLLLSLVIAGTLRVPLSPEEDALLSLRPDWKTARAVLALSLVVGTLIGCVPAVAATRFSLPASLQLHSGLGGSSSGRLRGLVVCIQVMISTVVLVGAVLLTRSVAHAARAGLLVLSDKTAIVTIEGSASYHATVVDRLQTMKGIAAIGGVMSLPLSRMAHRQFTLRQDQRGVSETVEAAINFASAGYFSTMGVPVVAGRALVTHDGRPDERNVVVNEAFAQRYLGRAPVGHKLEDSKGQTLYIVGVVRNQMYRALQGPPTPMVYYPVAHGHAPRLHLIARTYDDAKNHLESYVRELGPISGGKLVEVVPFESHLANVLLQERLATLLVHACGLSTLLLTVLGVYAVAADQVRRRIPEVALRLALGATQFQLCGPLSRSTFLAIAAGASLGMATVLLLLRVVRWLVFLPSIDGTPITAVTALVVSIAAVSVTVPVWKAVRMNAWAILRS